MVLSRAFTRIALAVAVIATLIVGALPATSARAADTRTIAGTVSVPTDAAEGALGRVTVQASPTVESAYYSANVDPTTGAYSLRNLPAGTYRVSFNPGYRWTGTASVRDNLVQEYWQDATSWSAATPVDVSSADATGIDASLVAGRTISGTVTIPADVAPAALGAVSVSASSFDGNGASGSAQVDPATGGYTITGLPSGSYRVSFAANPYWNGSTSVRPNLVNEYWNDATDYSSSTPVDLTAGDASGIDAALVSGRTISGTVTLPAGVPASAFSSIGVSASPVAGGGPGGYANVDPQTGAFAMSGLVPGSYLVQFSVNTWGDAPNLVNEYWNDSLTRAGATPVDVTAADATKMDAALAAGTTISGTVSIPDDAPREWLGSVSVNIVGADGNMQGASTPVDPATGAYTITRVPPGSHTVFFNATGYWNGSSWVPTDLVPEYYNDVPTIQTSTPVDTSRGSAVGIDARLDHGGSLSGTIDLTALRNRPDEGFGVALVDATTGEVTREWGDPLAYDSAPFNYGNLRPGTYRVAVRTDDWDPAVGRILKSFQYLSFGGTSTLTVVAGQAQTGLTTTAQAVTATVAGTMSVTEAAEGRVRLYSMLTEGWAPSDTGVRQSGPGQVAYSVAVPPGTYTVGFESVPGSAAVRQEWWDRRASLATADRIVLASGGSANGVNGTLGGPAPVRGVTFSLTSSCTSAETLNLALTNPTDQRLFAHWVVRDSGQKVVWRDDRALRAGATATVASSVGREDATYTVIVSTSATRGGKQTQVGSASATIDCVTTVDKPTVAGLLAFIKKYDGKLTSVEKRKLSTVISDLRASRDPGWSTFLQKNPGVRKLWEAWVAAGGRG